MKVVSTDPIFANCRSLFQGFTGAQVFYGCTSRCINVGGFKEKGEFPKLYQDFIREQGAPSILRRDNAKEEASYEVLEINRKFYIKDQYSEAYNPQQNPMESQAIRYLKQASHTLMDRVGAPPQLWYYAIQYLCEIHNRTSHPLLPDKITPHQMRFGVTPDISALPPVYLLGTSVVFGYRGEMAKNQRKTWKMVRSVPQHRRLAHLLDF